MSLQSTLDQINRLQKTEEELYNTLTKNAQNVASGKESTLSEDEIQEMTIQINSLSEARTELYNLIGQLYQQEVKSTGTLKNSYDEQLRTLKLLETQLSDSKTKLAKLEDKKYNQLKMIEINTYYSKEYDAYRKFFKLITIIGLCILITLLLDYFSFLSGITRLLRFLIFIVGGFFVARQSIDMIKRSYMNYDEYTWFHAPTTADELGVTNSTSNIIEVSGVDIPYICAEGGCCGEGTIWKDNLGCVLDPAKI